MQLKWGKILNTKALVITASAISLSLLSGCNVFDSKLVAACETALKERLKAPSGYKRIKVAEYQREISIDQYAQFRYDEEKPLSQDRIVLMKKTASGSKMPTVFQAFIDYDAPNSYGTPLRSLAQCEHVSSDGSNDVDARSVRVNGLNSFEFMLEKKKVYAPR
jgi:hypothetical protein